MSWLISKALMNSLCLQELEAEYSEENSLGGEQSVPLSGSPTQQAYCALDKMTAFSRLSRFGMTYKPLTEGRGEELLTLYLEDFRAKTSVPQEKEQGLMENEAECGEKWRASFTKYDPDLCLWKTHQCSLVEGLESFSETWPQWGLMRNGECWEQIPLDSRTIEPEFGWLPTPVVSDAMGAGRAGPRKNRNISSLKDYLSKYHKLAYPPVIGVECMMGWPLGWTDLKPLEMDKSHFVQQLLGES